MVLASLFWGTTGTAASLIADVSPLAVGASAMGFGGLLLVCHARRELALDAKRLLAAPRLLALGGLAVAIYPLAFYSAMAWSGVAIGTLVSIASAPFFSVLLERLISKKAISGQWWVAFSVGVLGAGLLTLGKQPSAAVGEHAQWLTTLGIVLGLLAALAYAIYSWAARQMIERGIRSSSAMASMFGLAALVLLPSLLFTGQHMFADGKHVAVMVYMAVVPMFGGYLCFGFALRHIKASSATLITLLEPVIATLFAITLVGEQFARIGWYGMALILLCMLLQSVRLPRRASRELTRAG